MEHIARIMPARRSLRAKAGITYHETKEHETEKQRNKADAVVISTEAERSFPNSSE